MPLQTMLVGALLGVERLCARKALGVGVAILGVGASLGTGLAEAPSGAWRGELLMMGAALCWAFYSVLSRPLTQRSSALGFVTVAMGSGVVALTLVALGAPHRLASLSGFGARQWGSVLYLGVVGSGLSFLLWSVGVRYASPTPAALGMTLNPVSAALLASVLLDEKITPNLLIGLTAISVGIWTATTRPRTAASRSGRA
jgi:drug/metabolite transporter (DMT)-like permease